jgi:glycine C-acetyltransferase
MTLPKARSEPPPAPSRLADPFDGFFRDAREHPRERLVDTPSARAWFELLRWGYEQDLYTFQPPLGTRSGVRVRVNDESLLMLSSYDYLGLIGHPRVTEASVRAIREFGTGPGGVRLLTGTTELHVDLERELADFKGTEAAITFNSGYMANLAVVPALVGQDDLVLLDEKAHRSIVDACRLTKATVRWFGHNDVASLQHVMGATPNAKRILIIVEGLYSMDGDVCPLPELVSVKEEAGAFLMVDEAHSFGSTGATGRGVDEFFGLPAGCVDVWTGSLSKAIPANGGFVAGSRELVVYLQHGGAPFMFSSALCPGATAAAREAVRILRAEPERLITLRDNAEALRSGLQALGYDTGLSESCIIPVVLGSDENAYRTARRLRSLGVLATAVVRPAVPAGGARLRLCATAAQSTGDVEEALDAFAVQRCVQP